MKIAAEHLHLHERRDRGGDPLGHGHPPAGPQRGAAEPRRPLAPREIVAELDRYVVGQAAAKRAVAIALRNRIRRQTPPAGDGGRDHAEEHPDDRPHRGGQDRDRAPTGPALREPVPQGRGLQVHRGRLRRPRRGVHGARPRGGRGRHGAPREASRRSASARRAQRRGAAARPAAAAPAAVPERRRPRAGRRVPRVAPRHPREAPGAAPRRAARSPQGGGRGPGAQLPVVPDPLHPGRRGDGRQPEGHAARASSAVAPAGAPSPCPRRARSCVQEEERRLVDDDQVARLAVERAQSSGIVFIDEIDKIAGPRRRPRARRVAGGRAARHPAHRGGDHGLHQVRPRAHRPHPLHRRGRLPREQAHRPHPRAAGTLPHPGRAAGRSARRTSCGSSPSPGARSLAQYRALLATEGVDLSLHRGGGPRDGALRDAGERGHREHRRPAPGHRPRDGSRRGLLRERPAPAPGASSSTLPEVPAQARAPRQEPGPARASSSDATSGATPRRPARSRPCCGLLLLALRQAGRSPAAPAPHAAARHRPQAVRSVATSSRWPSGAPAPRPTASRLGRLEVEMLRAARARATSRRLADAARSSRRRPGEAISESDALPAGGTTVRIAARALARRRASSAAGGDSSPQSPPVRPPLATPSWLRPAVALAWTGARRISGGGGAPRRERRLARERPGPRPSTTGAPPARPTPHRPHRRAARLRTGRRARHPGPPPRRPGHGSRRLRFPRRALSLRRRPSPAASPSTAARRRRLHDSLARSRTRRRSPTRRPPRPDPVLRGARRGLARTASWRARAPRRPAWPWTTSPPRPLRPASRSSRWSRESSCRGAPPPRPTSPAIASFAPPRPAPPSARRGAPERDAVPRQDVPCAASATRYRLDGRRPRGQRERAPSDRAAAVTHGRGDRSRVSALPGDIISTGTPDGPVPGRPGRAATEGDGGEGPLAMPLYEYRLPATATRSSRSYVRAWGDVVVCPALRERLRRQAALDVRLCRGRGERLARRPPAAAAVAGEAAAAVIEREPSMPPPLTSHELREERA